MAKTHARSTSRGNGAYMPTLSDLDRRLIAHEKDDQDRHEEINASIKGIGSDVKGMRETLSAIVTERQAETLFEKWKQKWLIGGITVAGVVIPLLTAIWDHWGK